MLPQLSKYGNSAKYASLMVRFIPYPITISHVICCMHISSSYRLLFCLFFNFIFIKFYWKFQLNAFNMILMKFSDKTLSLTFWCQCDYNPDQCTAVCAFPCDKSKPYANCIIDTLYEFIGEFVCWTSHLQAMEIKSQQKNESMQHTYIVQVYMKSY